MKADNNIYEAKGNAWWDDDAGFEFTSLRYCVNPVRYGYFRRILQQLKLPGKAVLDIGCGGGFLAEEFAKDGFSVTAIDPAPASIKAAQSHAHESRLPINYLVGQGEMLPFPDNTFDIVTCCDVLEHVDDPAAVISQAARTLKPGGVFFFDTINRTLQSKVVMIKMMQEWDSTRLLPANTHVWKQFIKPDELAAIMSDYYLVCHEMKGISASDRFAMFRKRAAIKRGLIRNQDLAGILDFRETTDLALSYMGFSIKSL